MQAHRIRVTIPESHEVTVRLPSDVPVGEAEIIVLTESNASDERATGFAAWLDSWISGLPAAPAIPLEALRRENLYE